MEVDAASPQDSTLDDKKTPVIRGARACTVCRTAKMKCVGADESGKPCDRCRRQNLDCIFEKHRRGRKPGSKLSEASKMLRRLEKGLSSAKAKGAALHDQTDAHSADDSASARSPYSSGPFPNNDLPPLKLPVNYGDNAHDPHYNGGSDDEDEENPSAAPAKLISKENQRQPFLKTILNPEQGSPAASYRAPATPANSRMSAFSWTTPPPAPEQPAIRDPVSAGIIDEAYAKVLFDLVFLRLNPFICLFDPALHSVTYVRSRSPFLFTVILMAGCKFFKPEAFRQCQKMANELATRAFAENWKSVEVVQAFACLCYWKEPEDTRTWTYIGYACRMAIELGLNRYHANPPPGENEYQLRERRNRERTYLVLFVHDRSLATQTGRAWMLPEDEIVRNAHHWHEHSGGDIRPEDVIVSAFVQLRCITAETTEVFHMHNNSSEHGDLDRAVLLRNCNGKLTQWMGVWETEMQRANGERFHMEFLKFFRLYVRLFLNSFGIQGSLANQTRAAPSVQALSMCYTSAIENLQIVYQEFAKMNMLRYCQDSITVMTAYCAVFLLRLLRSSTMLAGLHENAADEIHKIISLTADAYEEAAAFSSACTSAAYHARFLRGLVAQDIFKARQSGGQALPGSRSSPPGGLPSPSPSNNSGPSYLARPTQMVPSQGGQAATHAPVQQPQAPQPQRMGHGMVPTSVSSYGPMTYALPQDGNALAQSHPHSYGVPQSSAADAQQQQYAPPTPAGADLRYWDQMFRDIGCGATGYEQQQQQPDAYGAGYGAPMPIAAYPHQYVQGEGVAYQSG